jgi:hypothetical protein
MGGLFSKPKSVKLRPPAPPAAIPEVGEEVEEIARRRRPRGRQETFLAGALVPGLGEGKKRLLG